MAKIPLLLGLAVTPLIEGEPTTEYDDNDEIMIEHDEPEVVQYQTARSENKYIEAKTGQRFSLKLEVGPPLGHAGMVYTKLVFEIKVDGIEAAKAFCDRPFFKRNPGAPWEVIVEGVTDNKGRKCTLKEFIFAKIETSNLFPQDPPPGSLTIPFHN
jgi:hypothetical protein